MRILATSDLHGNLSDLNFDNIDVVVIAGDFAELKGGGKWHWNDQKKWIQKKFIPMIESHPNTQFVITPGNHDLCMDISKTSLHPDINFNIQWPINAHILIDREVVINGIKFYGSPWVPIISYRWAFEAETDKLSERFSKIPEDVDVLITHTPPHIDNETCIDRSIQWGATEAFGSWALADEIAEKQPKYVFCGHIHTGTHGGVKFLNSMIYNVSRLDERYEIAYEPTIIEM